MTHDLPHLGSEHDASDDAPERADAAHKSMADALRMSFRLLSFMMVVVLVALLITGAKQVHPGQAGVRLILGRISGEGDARVLQEGLHWSLPEPIGQIITVPTGQQSLDMKDFWPHETPENENKRIQEWQFSAEGLRPGYDGALITGDRALVHAKFNVQYSIKRRQGRPDPEAIIHYVSNLRPPEEPRRPGGAARAATPGETVRSAVANAAIAAAAGNSVDAICTAGKEAFVERTRQLANARLDELKSGLQVERINAEVTVPVAVIPAFEAVAAARTDLDRMRSQALAEATRTLASAAGASYVKLVGEDGYGGLIRQYADARERNDRAEAERLLAQVTDILTSESEGEAAGVINAARGYSATVRQQVEARANTFARLKDAFAATPELVLQRQWADVKTEILGRSTNEKYYLTAGQKTVLKVNRDPEVVRRILLEILKAREKESSEAKRRGGS